ncbi:MAG: CotH kinase family protein [Candidatus Saccharimonadales bacterium]
MVERARKNTSRISLVLILLAVILLGVGAYMVISGKLFDGKAESDNLLEYGMWDEEVAMDLKNLPDDETLAAQVEELFNVDSIPVVNLSTEVEIMDGNEYKNLSMSIVDGAVEENNYKNLTGGIRTRGNSTYRIGKEYGAMPYKIKLDEKIDLFGMGKSKKWCLIANFIDRSYIKQFIMYQTAQLMMGEEYFQPKAKYVEVYMNGEYMGLYLLTESIE